MTAVKRQDSGAATLETVIVFPAVLLLTVGAMQMGLWFYARTVCLGAAQEAVRVAATFDGTVGAATAVGDTFLGRVGHGLVDHALVTVTRSADTATVTVTAQSLSIVPLWPIDITQSAHLPVERETR